MRKLPVIAGLLLLTLLAACSLGPERPFTRQDLFKTNVFTYFTVKESPDSVLAALNREGEVVVEGIDKTKKSWYIKIMTSGKTLKTTYIEK
jgi:hypothetical protein